jgi:hypothetical protein
MCIKNGLGILLPSCRNHWPRADCLSENRLSG